MKIGRYDSRVNRVKDRYSSWTNKYKELSIFPGHTKKIFFMDLKTTECSNKLGTWEWRFWNRLCNDFFNLDGDAYLER